MAPSKMLDETENSPDVLAFYPRSLCQRYRADQLKVPVTKEVLDPARIGWQPDYETFLAREAARLRVGGPPTPLPEGFPQEMKGDMVWSGLHNIKEEQYTLELQDFQKTEVDGALNYCKGWIWNFSFAAMLNHQQLETWDLMKSACATSRCQLFMNSYGSYVSNCTMGEDFASSAVWILQSTHRSRIRSYSLGSRAT